MADYAILVLNGLTFFATHGHLFNQDQMPPLKAGDILVHGHTHLLKAEKVNGHYILNPGSTSIPKGGNPATYAILDEQDFIEDSYIMEISSPGLDRPLKKEKDFKRSLGKLVEIRTYRPIEKQKEFCGILNAYDSNSVTIDEDGTERTFDKKDIALIRLAIEF